jgi:hypothetical protein
VYGDEPSASAGREAPAGKALWGGGRRAASARAGDGAARDVTVTVDWVLPGQVGMGAPRLAATYDMLVVDQQSGRWYVKDIRASTQPMGTQ